jgi:Ca2+-binding RTX toxin-like protein
MPGKEQEKGNVRRGSLALAVACAWLFAGAGDAQAVDVRTNNYWDVIDYDGVDNDVVISEAAPGKVRVTDTAGVTFIHGDCVAEGPNSAVCDIQLPNDGASVISMNEGNDSLTIIGFPWVAYASGGAGDDTITAPVPQVVPDVPWGPGGNVRVLGGPGNDMLIGSQGPDILYGQDGSDVCLGGAGADHCGGGLGDDVCDMGPGRDRCIAVKGRDTCLGGPGGDVCNGGRGRDSCDGGGGRDLARHCESTRRAEKRL